MPNQHHHSSEGNKTEITVKGWNLTPQVITYWFQSAEYLCPCCFSLHCICNNCFCQRLWTAWFADQEERNTKLNADDHHEQVFFQSLISGNIWTKIYSIQKHVLAAATNAKLVQTYIKKAGMSSRTRPRPAAFKAKTKAKATKFCRRGVLEDEDSPRGPHPCEKGWQWDGKDILTRQAFR